MTFDESPVDETVQTDHEREVSERAPGEGDGGSGSRPTAEEDRAADMQRGEPGDEDR